jgi:ferric-dicitrate binding protein FerR (iron transport regulator)
VVDCQSVREALLACERGHAPAPALKAHQAACPDCERWAARCRAVDGALVELTAEVLDPPPFERIERPARAAARGRRQLRLARRLVPMSLVFASAVAATMALSWMWMVRRAPTLAAAVATSGQVLDAPQGAAQVLLTDGSHLTLTSGRAVVELSERHRSVVRLETGTVFLDVPHLGNGDTFVLTTTEAEVRVHGTRFDVARSGEGTRIGVSDGTVEVRPRTGGGKPFFVTKGGFRVLPTEPSAAESARGQAAVAWKLSREGDRAGAMASYRRALSLLPAGAGPLWADNACAQLALLSERDDTREREAAWRAYLERFPEGVHAAMARARLARPARSGPR